MMNKAMSSLKSPFYYKGVSHVMPSTENLYCISTAFPLLSMMTLYTWKFLNNKHFANSLNLGGVPCNFTQNIIKLFGTMHLVYYMPTL